MVDSLLHFFTLTACWQARGTLVPHQYPTPSSSSFTGTSTKAIMKPACVLPTLDLAYASGRAFKMVSIVFCAGRLILLAQTHTNHHTSRLDGKIKSSSYNVGDLLKYMQNWKAWLYDQKRKKIYSPTQPFSLIKTCIHETHQTPVNSSLIMGFTNSIKCNWWIQTPREEKASKV